jgi:signal transduction histidine kinase
MLGDLGQHSRPVVLHLDSNCLPSVAEHVFDPFYTTKAQGSGLGLAIVRKIVDAHDGQIDLRTVPGGGTLIRVTLPVSVSRDAL